MKLIEKILGGLIILLMVFGLLFRFPYSAILITLSCAILSILYFYFSFALLNNIRLRNCFKKKSYTGISALRIIGVIFTGFILSIVVIYSLFKFQRWLYGQIGLQIGLTLLLSVIVTVSIKYFTSKKVFYSSFLIRLLTIGIFSSILYFIPSTSLLEIRYKDYPDYISAKKELLKDPENKYLQRRVYEERIKMESPNN